MRVYKKYLFLLTMFATILVQSPMTKLEEGARFRNLKENLCKASVSADGSEKTLEQMVKDKDELESIVAILSGKITKETWVRLEAKAQKLKVARQAAELRAKKHTDEAMSQLLQVWRSVAKQPAKVNPETKTPVIKAYELPKAVYSPTLFIFGTW